MERKTSWTRVFAFIALFSFIFNPSNLIFWSLVSPVYAAVPHIVNYQGRLEDSTGNVLGGALGTDFTFHFSIWNTSSTGGGSMLWPGSGTAATATLPVFNGVFDARLGDATLGFPVLDLNFNTSTVLYLQIEVFNATTSLFETLSPRQAIVSAGFAINADTVSGASVGTSSNNVLLLNASGSINLPGGQIRPINSASCSGLAALGGGSLCYDVSNNNLFVFNSASSSWVALGGSSSTGGSLQQAYDLGNTITATSSRDISFTLSDTAVDPNFIVNIQTSSTSAFKVQYASADRLFVSSSTIVLSSPTTVSSSLTVVGGVTSLQGLTFSNATGTNVAAANVSSTNVSSTNVTATGYATIATLNFNNASGTGPGNLSLSGYIQGASLAITNAGTFATVSSTNITLTNATASGNIQAGSLSITNAGTFGTVSSTGITFVNATGTRLSATNVSSTNVSASGYLQGASLNISSGVSTLQGITFVNATGTGNLQTASLNTTGNVNVSGTLNVTGVTGLQGLAFVNATGTGNLGVGSLTVTNAGTFATVSSTNITFMNATGTNLTVLGSIYDVGGNKYVTSTSAGGGSVSTSSPITQYNFPYWNSVGGALSGTSTLTISGTQLLQGGAFNASGTITQNGSAVLTSAVTSANSITGAVNWLASGIGLSVASSGQNITYTIASSSYLQPSNNLSEITSSSSARTSLGLGTAATQATTNWLASSTTYVATTTNVSSTNLTVGGYGIIATLKDTGGNLYATSTIANLSSTNATFGGYVVGTFKDLGGNAYATSSIVVNMSSTNISVSGWLMGNSLKDTNGNAYTTSTIATFAFTNASGTNLTVGTAIDTAKITATNVSSTNMTVGTYLVATAKDLGGNLYVTSSVITNMSSTNISASGWLMSQSIKDNAGNAYTTSTIANLSSTNITASGYLVATAKDLGGNLYVTSSVITNMSSTNISVSGWLMGNSLRDTNGNAYTTSTIPGLLFTNATGTNINVSFASSTGITFVNATGTNLNLGTLVSTNVSSTGATFTNATGTNLSAANLSSTRITAGTSIDTTKVTATNVSSTNMTIGTYLLAPAFDLQGNAYRTSTIPGLLFTNATGTNINISSVSSTGITFVNATGTNLTVANVFDVSGNRYVTSTSGGGVTSLNNLTGVVIATGTVNQIVVSTSSGQLVFSIPTQLSVTNVSATNITASGSIQGGSLSVTNAGTFGTVSSTGITFTNATGSGSLVLSYIGGPQCLHVDSSGKVSGAGSDCVSGVGSAGGWTATSSFVFLTTASDQVGIGATSSAAKFFVQTTNVGTTTALLQGMAGQTADIFQVALSSGLVTFQVSNTGVASSTELRAASSTITNLSITNATATSNLTLGYISGGGNQCLHVDNTGKVTGASQDCGSGTGSSGWTTIAGFVSLATSTDQVGIGATSSAAKFFVQTTSVGTTTALLQGMAGQTADIFQVALSSGLVTFQVSNTGVASSTEFRTASSTITNLAFTNATGTGNLRAGTITLGTSTAAANALLTIATTSNIFTILNNGNIGIGTTSPQSKLHVYQPGDAQWSEIISDAGSTSSTTAFSLYAGGLRRWLIVKDGTAETGGNEGSDFRIGRYGDNGYAIGDTQIFIKRSTGDVSINGTLNVINNTGYVGIGTTYPSSTLHVIGSLIVSGSSTFATVSSTGITFVNATGTRLSATNVSSTNVSASGYGLFPTLGFTNASGTNTTLSGYLQAGNFQVTAGPSSLQAFTFTNATGTNLQTASLNTTGNINVSGTLNVTGVTGLQGLTFVNATGTNLSATNLSSTRITAGTSIDTTKITATNVSSTNLSASTAIDTARITATNVSSTNMTVGTYLLAPAFDLQGNAYRTSTIPGLLFTNATGTNINVSFASSTGITFVNATGTNLTVLGSIYDAGGNKYVTSTSAGGVSSLNSLTGAVIATGTTNQITVSTSTGQLVFSMPQNIDTSANVTFNGVNFTNATGTNLAILGSIYDAGGNRYVTSTSAGGGSVSTSSPITQYNFPYWNSVGGALSGTSTLQQNGTTLLQGGAFNASGTITQNGTAVLTSAVTSANGIVGAVNWLASGIGLSVASSGQNITFTIASSSYLQPSNNLSELTVTSTARTNLGLGTIATFASTDYLASSTPYVATTTNVSSTNITVTGYGVIGTLKDVGGNLYTTSTIPGLLFTNATGTNINVSSASSTSITFVNATGTNLNLGTLVGTTVSSTGATFTNATGTNLSATNLSSTRITAGTSIDTAKITATNVSSTNLSASTAIDTAKITATNVSSTNLTAATAIDTARITATNVSSTNVSASGYLQGASLSISSGVSSLQGITFTNATGTNLQTASLNTTGNINVSGTLNVTGVTGLQGVTFTNATGTGNLQVATLVTTGDITDNGRLALGTTTFTGAVSIASSTSVSGGVAGIFENLTINPTAADGFQFGNRELVNVSTTATTTAIGSFIRMIDNTSLGNTVRGLEVQAYSGTNIQGVNTGIIAFGRTFGIQGITTGEAGGVAQPAGVYGELQNGTQGNAIRAYSATSTSADLVQFFQEASTFAGNGLLMNFGNGGGSFSGNFMNLKRAGITKFAVNATGTLVLGSSTAVIATSSMLVVCAQTNCSLPATTTGAVAWFASVSGTTSTNSIVAKGSIVGNAADFGEYVPVVGSSTDYEAGDLLSITSSSALFAKSLGTYDAMLAGAISGGAAFIGGLEDGTEGKVVLTLAGRILVKVNGESGAIKAGDFIAASSEAGQGMKAAQAGRVLGMALEPFAAENATSSGKILVLVNPHWYAPQVTAEALQGGSGGTGPTLNTYTFDPNTTYNFNNLVAQNITTQNLTIGTSTSPSGVTIFDVETKNPYCIIVENGILKAVPGNCGEGVTTGVISTSTANTNSTAAVANQPASAPETTSPPPDTSGSGETAIISDNLGGTTASTTTTTTTTADTTMSASSSTPVETSSSTVSTTPAVPDMATTTATTTVDVTAAPTVATTTTATTTSTITNASST